MTYYNVVLRAGHRRMASRLAEAGVSAAIVPDLPLEELDGWAAEADEAGIETVLLVAPTTPEDRLKAICARSRGFVYGVGVMGVTGERASLGEAGLGVAARCKRETDTPVLVGVGISTPEQARGSRRGRRRRRGRLCSCAPALRRCRARGGSWVRSRVEGRDRSLIRATVRFVVSSLRDRGGAREPTGSSMLTSKSRRTGRL